MTTISIENAKGILRKKFKDLSDLQDYLLIQQFEKEFSLEFINEINNRETDLLKRKVKGISWKDVQKKLDNDL